MIILEADCVAKAYGSRQVLSSASLRAHAGSVTALCGRNGAGKSTLMGIAAGWTRADQGIVRMDGTLVPRPGLPALARRGLFFLRDRELLTPGVPVRRQLEAVARSAGVAADIPALAETLGIGRQLDLTPPRLSGGETRRAEIALVLVRRPRCLLADEPFRGISPLDIEAIVQALRGLAAGGAAVVISGHEVGALLDAADRVVWCVGGSTREFASASAAREDWQFRQEYLGDVPGVISQSISGALNA